MKKKINIGMIGTKFMGKAHSHAIKDVSMFFDLDVEPVMMTLCGTAPDLPDTAKKYGWENWTSNWMDVINDPKIDAVVILTPGFLHKDMVIAAAEKGKHIMCEKPLANSYSEAKEMLEIAENNKIIHMTNFVYRRIPAIELAKKLIDEGKLGEIYHFRALYQQDWAPDSDWVWRFDQKQAGSGSMSDKGSHIIDLARYLVGEMTEVVADSKIFLGEKRVPKTEEMKEVTTDDACMFITRFANGAMGLFETSRISTGHKNYLSFEINGSKGSVMFNLERLNELSVYLKDNDPSIQGFRTVMMTDPAHPFMSHMWPAGHIIGWEHGFIFQYYAFFKGISENKNPNPSFEDGLKAQAIIEAVITSVAEKRWISI